MKEFAETHDSLGNSDSPALRFFDGREFLAQVVNAFIAIPQFRESALSKWDVDVQEGAPDAIASITWTDRATGVDFSLGLTLMLNRHRASESAFLVLFAELEEKEHTVNISQQMVPARVAQELYKQLDEGNPNS